MGTQTRKPQSRFEEPWVIRLCGLGMVLGVVAVVTLCLVMFAGGFENTVKVSVESPRSGLVLDPDAKVKIRGVEIGKVSGVHNTADGARIDLELDPEQLRMVPANAVVDIRSTTVFGAKYINFVAPQNASKESLQPGAVVRASSVTVEFNTLFQHLNDVLAKIEPEKLNATLQAVGSALQGRGEKINQLLVDSEAFLRDINSSLPTLQEDLRKTTQVTGLYADTVPDLLRTTDNLVVTGGTLAERAGDLDLVLTNIIGLADTATPILNETESPLVEALRLLHPATDTLYEYRTAVSCVVNGLGPLMPLYGEIFGGRYPAVSMNASLMPAGEPYKYPEDLPKVNATGGPHCEDVTGWETGDKANYLVTDTSQGHVWQPPTQPSLNEGTVFELLFAGLPGVR
ncbi:MCE family protein [Nocardia otitidiscaviarum]|uniref:MCE family protein n=1 Tax=Nocardia otitidiscaviarum TaxID=1823 RepID=UPI001894AABD|nr:MCE family protein [Nocardia otitidiscaviarum]MBF6179289.1 MCE family protein [Nocardia otitidiscaviarum]